MSQHDLTIANQGFPAFRADLNDALQALGSCQSGTSAPSPTFANQLWYDTTNNILKIRNEDNDAWISIATLDQTGDLVASFTATNITAATALIADTINEKTSAAGVTIDGVLLKDGEVNAVGVVKALGTASGGGELRAYEDTDNGTNFVSLKAPATLAADKTFVLPSTDGTSGQALTTDGSGNLAFSTVSTATTLLKNRIINGAMMINQRNFSGNMTTAGISLYTLDRWQGYFTLNDKYSVSQNAGSVTPPVGFTKYLGVTSLAATTVGAGDFFLLNQNIEGFNVADLGWGTANAKTVTISFWVRSSLTGTFGGALNNSASDRSYPYTYTISAANTWEQKSVTIAGDTSGTWLTTNGIGVQLQFGLGAGSTYSGTAGSWAGSAYYSATGATSVVGTSGATFYITGVQLEVGSSATGFEYRQYGTEYDLCRRYFEALSYVGSSMIILGTGYSTSAVDGTLYYYPKRATPTLTLPASGTSTGQIAYLKADSTYPSTIGSIATGSIGLINCRLNGTGYTGAWAAGNALWLYSAGGTTIQVSAEL